MVGRLWEMAGLSGFLKVLIGHFSPGQAQVPVGHVQTKGHSGENLQGEGVWFGRVYKGVGGCGRV